MIMNSCRSRAFVAIISVALVPIVMGGCPPTMPTPPAPPPGETTLLTKTDASSLGTFITMSKCAAPVGGDRGFIESFNAVAGKLVTIKVTGPVSNSRPQVQVVDIVGTQVANSGPTPTTQTNTTTFTPAASNLFILRVQECANVAVGSAYTVLVTQAP